VDFSGLLVKDILPIPSGAPNATALKSKKSKGVKVSILIVCGISVVEVRRLSLVSNILISPSPSTKTAD
jgi:hypothetical protein